MFDSVRLMGLNVGIIIIIIICFYTCYTLNYLLLLFLPPKRRLCFHLHLFFCMSVNGITKKLKRNLYKNVMEWLDIIQGATD